MPSMLQGLPIGKDDAWKPRPVYARHRIILT